MSHTKQPKETTRLLGESLRIAMATEHIGEVTLLEMQLQGEKLGRTKEQLEEIKTMTEAARLSVKKIREKIFRKKLQLWITVITLFVIIIYLVARMLMNDGKLI